MAPTHAMVFLSQEPSTENWQFRVAVLVLADEGPLVTLVRWDEDLEVFTSAGACIAPAPLAGCGLLGMDDALLDMPAARIRAQVREEDGDHAALYTFDVAQSSGPAPPPPPQTGIRPKLHPCLVVLNQASSSPTPRPAPPHLILRTSSKSPAAPRFCATRTAISPHSFAVLARIM